jgi:hypothetical protein
MRHIDYRTTLKHYTVLGLTDTGAAMDRLPGIAPERQANAATGTTDAAPDAATDSCTNRPQLFCQQLERETVQNRAASRGKLASEDDATKNEDTQQTPGFLHDLAKFSAKRAKGLEPSTYSLEGCHSTTELRPQSDAS